MADQSVLIGYVNKEDEIKNDLHVGQPWKVNKIGGVPFFSPMVNSHRLLNDQNTFTCEECKRKLTLICQMYCPVDEKEDDRVLYVFACVFKECKRRQWTALRVMTPPIYVENVFKEVVSSSKSDWLESDDNWDDGDSEDLVSTDVISTNTVAAATASSSCSSTTANAYLTINDRIADSFSPFYVTVNEEINLIASSTQNCARETTLSEGCTVSVENSSGQEVYEKFLVPGTDPVAHKFLRTLSKFPGQVVRYNWNGDYLVNKNGVVIANDKCVCGSKRTFEFQLMPGLMSFLTAKEAREKDSLVLDFGTVLIFSCLDNCKKEQVYIEQCLVFEDPDNSIITDNLSKV